jgi:hypothetical protein
MGMGIDMTFARRIPVWVWFAGANTWPWIITGAVVAFFGWTRSDGSDGSLLTWIQRYAVFFGSLAVVDGVVSGLLFSRVAKNHRLGEWSLSRLLVWGCIGGAVPLGAFGIWTLVIGTPQIALLPVAMVGMVLAGAGSAMSSVVALVYEQRTAIGARAETDRLSAT